MGRESLEATLDFVLKSGIADPIRRRRIAVDFSLFVFQCNGFILFKEVLTEEVEVFSKLIDDCASAWDYKEHWDPYTAIVQSSGFGKTRLIREFSRKRFVVYCCLRPADSIGFPGRSSTANIFMHYEQPLKTEFYFLQCFSFFLGCVQIVINYIQSQAREVDTASFFDLQVQETIDSKNGTALSGENFWSEFEIIRLQVHQVITDYILGKYSHSSSSENSPITVLEVFHDNFEDVLE